MAQLEDLVWSTAVSTLVGFVVRFLVAAAWRALAGTTKRRGAEAEDWFE